MTTKKYTKEIKKLLKQLTNEELKRVHALAEYLTISQKSLTGGKIK